MAKLAAGLLGGVLLGVLATLTLVDRPSRSPESGAAAARDLVDVPRMSQAVADQHRDEGYQALTTVKQVLSLPSDFARSEALYALAGRMDAAGVQSLIDEADRIADEQQRVPMLQILFMRLTELDPYSALALARTERFRVHRTVEQSVWRAWGRMDFDGALFAARSQTSHRQQKRSAQYLYTAFGYMDNELTARIEEELGVPPDRNTRARYLYRLADQSPAEAIEFINRQDRGANRQQFVSWLAGYLALDNPQTALTYASLFDVASERERYRQTVNRAIARQDPRFVIEQYLTSDQSGSFSYAVRSAVQELAKTDLDSVKRYFDQAESQQDRATFANTIVRAMAKSEPMEALTWAREHEQGGFGRLQMTALSTIAVDNPRLAFEQTLQMHARSRGSPILSIVMGVIADRDPLTAVGFLDEIKNDLQYSQAAQSVVSTWMDRAPEQAMAWLHEQEASSASNVAFGVAGSLVDQRVDTAIRLLPLLDGEQKNAMRQQITNVLAQRRSPADAQAFIRQFEGEPGYDQLQASLVSGVALTDVSAAKQLADQLPAGDARDSAYVSILTMQAAKDPVQAAAWLDSMAGSSRAGIAAGEIARAWHEQDPAAARRWVSAMPASGSKNVAILSMAATMAPPTREMDQLIATIGDKEMRAQAKLQGVYRLLESDPAAARERLKDTDISDHQRRQFEEYLLRSGRRL